MADIDLYQEDCEDSQDDVDDAGLSGEEGANPDDALTPLQKMEKYMDSENIFSRQMVARTLMETLRAVGDSPEEATAVLANMARLAEDSESTVRADLMEQVPHIAMYCQENKHLAPNALPAYILPIITRYLVDSHNQVRKTSQAALLVLLEQELVDRGDFEEQVCPVILDLSSAESIDDFRTEAVALMSKMAPLVGKDITERVFMPRFAEMCTDSLFHVRKVCAANFGDICAVVGQENVEMHLLSKFMFLCEDGVWGVRKACAECFMEVACACTLDVRKTELASLFVNLISDQSRWVRMGAFQALGGFISTFADPSNTGLYFNDEGILVAGNPHDFANKMAEEDHPEAEQLVEELMKHQQCDNNPRLTGRKAKSPPPEERCPPPSEPISQESVSSQSDANTIPQPMEIDEKSLEDNTEIRSDESVSLEEKRAKALHLPSDTISSDTECKQCSNNDNDNNSSSNSKTCDISKNIKSEICDTTYGTTYESTSNNYPCKRTPTSESSSNPDEDDYNNFNFWRMPLPEVDVDDVNGEPAITEILDKDCPVSVNSSLTSSTEVDVLSTALDEAEIENISKEIISLDNIELNEDAADVVVASVEEESEEDEHMMHMASIVKVSPTEDVKITTEHVFGMKVSEQMHLSVADSIVHSSQDSPPSNLTASSSNATSEDDEEHAVFIAQDVIPQALLDHYLSMSEPSRAQTVDADIARHCAYSLPAVAYTLGRRFWPCLRDLYETLAADMQWKVRRTLAFSIHELAIIVGEDITNDDLVPVFNGFLKDLDEVRVGVLKHLADFLSLLRPEARAQYLTRINEFLDTDNSRNWRFRQELGAQLLLLTDLYEPEDISQHLVPVALALAEDRIADVRTTALRVLATMLRHLALSHCDVLVSTFINDILQRFSASRKWSRRQTFAHLCQHVLEVMALPPATFSTMLLPSLLALGQDPIPNVRISLAKVLACQVMHSDYLTSASNPHHEDLLSVVKHLQSDGDRDVRSFLTEKEGYMQAAAGSQLDFADLIPV